MTAAVLVANGRTLLAGGGGSYNMYISTDSGSTWTLTGSLTTFITTLAASGTNIYAAAYDHGVLRSTDNGVTWATTGIATGVVTALAIVGTDVFAGNGDGSIVVSKDSGVTWTTSWVGGSPYSTTVYALTVSGKYLLASTYRYGVFLSMNSGKDWRGIGLEGGSTVSVNSLIVKGSNIFAGTAYGVCRRSLYDFIELADPQINAAGVGIPKTFKWRKNPRALAYAFQISNDPGFASLAVNQYTVDTAFTVSTLQSSTVYYWRVRAENSSWASEWANGNFTTKLNAIPTPVSPISGVDRISRSPTLKWTSVVSTATYTVQVSHTSDFSAVTYATSTANTEVTVPELQGLTKFYWRVRAQTPGDTSAWSTVSSFTTLPNAPSKITLVYPDSSKQDTYQNDWLTWQEDNTATAYLIQISQSPLFTSIFDSATVKSAGYRNANNVFTYGSTYFWRVRGSNIGGDGPFSSVWSFRVGSATRVPITFCSSSNLDCGRVKVGQFKDTVATISNNGNDTLKIINISSSNNSFSVRPTSRTLPPGQSLADTIRFAPTVIGMAASNVIVSSNSSTGSDTIKVSGFGYGQGVASISSANIAIGRIKLGRFKDTTIIISNAGNDTLKITNIASSNVVFSVHITNKTIPPGQAFVDTIRYTPTSIGTTSAAIALSSNSPTSPDTVNVSGFGYGEATISMNTSVISFGSIRVWQYKDTLVTISNLGSDTLKIQSIYVYGGMFSARPFSGFAPPGKSFNDTIRFSPSSYGNIQATIVLLSNSPSARDTIRVSGVGLAGALKFNVARMDFGLVLLGKSKDTAVTVLNQGNDTLKISSITCKHPAITSASAFLIIPPNGSAIDTFRFAPQTVGSVLGTMLFVNNGLGTYDTLQVIGSGVTATTGIAQDGVPNSFEVKQNYPNPFNPSTIISYSLPKTAIVSLKIFNALGQEIMLLVNEQRSPGYYQVQWNANVPSGIYFYRLQAGEFIDTKKAILLK